MTYGVPLRTVPIYLVLNSFYTRNRLARLGPLHLSLAPSRMDKSRFAIRTTPRGEGSVTLYKTMREFFFTFDCPEASCRVRSEQRITCEDAAAYRSQDGICRVHEPALHASH